MKDFAGDVVRQVRDADAALRGTYAAPPAADAAPRDADPATPATDAAPPAEPASARRWHAAVRAASARTQHELHAGDAPRDRRYASGDPDVDRLWLALHEVADPELPVSLVDLGLICDVRRTGAAVEVDLTFTASACPCMEFIIEDVRTRLLREDDVTSVAVRDVWDPPWTTHRMTEHGRALLRSFGTAA
jgi:metal-sulfur cluster biosynthetic enzyme